ncbi:MAG: helix-turn-helix domain-containing protein [Bacteroidales bacterium]|nr:helix-turn-helix domain-containing protein [Bacteroidales bacterium]
MNTIFTIGIFLAFFLFSLLLFKKDKTIEDKILAIWMLIIGIHLLSYFIYSLGYWNKYPHLVGISNPFPLLHGPLLYLYTSYSLCPEKRFRLKDYLHFLPAALSYISMFPFFFGCTAEEKRLIDQGIIKDFDIIMYISLVFFIISGIIYPILSYRLLNKYQKLIKENFAYNENISLQWLKMLISGIGLIYIAVMVVYFFQGILGMNFGFNADMIFFSIIIALVFALGHFGIRYQGIFTDNVIERNEIVEPRTAAEYKKSGLTFSDGEVLHEKLLKLMETKKPFLVSKLTLSKLADQLESSPNNLSQVINQYEEKNFYDFINGYRVEEFIKRASMPENSSFNILGIALDSGFNSKSSFNQVFKRHTGVTPSQYLENN